MYTASKLNSGIVAVLKSKSFVRPDLGKFIWYLECLVLSLDTL